MSSMLLRSLPPVIAGLDPAIQGNRGLDARVKPRRDKKGSTGEA
jgi:hypothetical protein